MRMDGRVDTSCVRFRMSRVNMMRRCRRCDAAKLHPRCRMARCSVYDSDDRKCRVTRRDAIAMAMHWLVPWAGTASSRRRCASCICRSWRVMRHGAVALFCYCVVRRTRSRLFGVIRVPLRPCVFKGPAIGVHRGHAMARGDTAGASRPCGVGVYVPIGRPARVRLRVCRRRSRDPVIGRIAIRRRWGFARMLFDHHVQDVAIARCMDVGIGQFVT